MAQFPICCRRALTDLANAIDSYERYPEQAQFVRALSGLPVEKACKKLTPRWPWSDEWWEKLRGIGQRGA